MDKGRDERSLKSCGNQDGPRIVHYVACARGRVGLGSVRSAPADRKEPDAAASAPEARTTSPFCYLSLGVCLELEKPNRPLAL